MLRHHQERQMNRTSAPGLVIACTVIAVSLPPQAAAQSFDCRKATTDVEKMICADKTLSKLDEELAQVFAAARKRVDPIVIGQPAWLRNVRSPCGDVECLKSAYASRSPTAGPEARARVPAEDRGSGRASAARGPRRHA
jgi:uncharacterized protein